MDLSKLTVLQLKALCKEKGLSGYSKLAKSALIEKLSAYTKSEVSGVIQATTPTLLRLEKSILQSETNKKIYQPQVEQVLVPIPQARVPRDEGRLLIHASNDQFQAGLQPTPAQSWAIEATQQTSIPLQLTQGARATPQVPQESQTIVPPRKKQKLTHTQGQQRGEAAKSQQLARAPNKIDVPKTIPVFIQQASNKSQEATHIAKATVVAAKRYVPLVIKQKDPIRRQEAARLSNPTQSSPASAVFVEQIPAGHLDFPPPDELSLSFKAITLPPSLAQRRHASKLALILRDTSIEDMPSLALSSKLFRYSGYLSAAYHLKRWYSGRRLEKVLVGISIDRMNLWPYRAAREEEVRKRREEFRRSFLGRFLGDDTSIGEAVWKSGDDVRQAVIAVRFLLTRSYVCISLNRDLAEVKMEMVVGVRKVVQDEIWCITTDGANGSQLSKKYYVMEATCEVIGSPVDLDGRLPTRTDWSTYIQEHMSKGDAGKTNIMGLIRWTNHEEYDQGISKIWLRRAQEEGELGKFKRVVAKRYILACTMENSLSGRYMTSSEMEHELIGLPSKTGNCHKNRGTKVNLFIPAHHHVESIHFLTASKRPLHPALAVVQTPSREYYILKDNGMQVGCEEEGISQVWMEVIGCNATGQPLRR